MNLRYHPAPRDDLHEAITYAQEEFDRGEELRQAIEDSQELINTFPKIGQLEEKSIRRLVINDFPFSIIYSIQPKKIYILAIMHDRREPSHWKSRF